MRWIDADSVHERDILLRDDVVFRVVKIEWPYAVVRDYVDGQFADRRVITLDGNYFVPTPEFLAEAGVYESRLLATESSQSFDDSFVLDVTDLMSRPDSE